MALEEAAELQEQFLAPLVAPRPPARLYFKFGRPIATAGRQAELSSKEAVQGLYGEIRQEVEGGIGYLLRKREEDPFRDAGWRLLFESTWGGRRAPTFRP